VIEAEQSMDGVGDDLAVALTEVDQLHHALDSRLTIGRAEGICMARLDIDAVPAFEYLKRLSSTTNHKLVEIAAEIAETRDLPKLD
jgi:AmiR/NasT family two-component response regulator